MFAHQPFGQACFGLCETQPRPKPPRDARASGRVVFRAALGNIVQQNREINDIAINFARIEQLKRNGVFLRRLALLDLGQQANGAQQMFICRVVMIHIELHHRHNTPEIRHKAAQHTGLVHAAQRAFGRASRCQYLQKQFIGPPVGAQFRPDQGDRPRYFAQCVGVDIQPETVRKVKHADQINRIGAETICPRHGQAATAKLEAMHLLLALKQRR